MRAGNCFDVQAHKRRGFELTAEEQMGIMQLSLDPWREKGLQIPAQSPSNFKIVSFGDGQRDGLTDSLFADAEWFFVANESGMITACCRLVQPVELRLYQDRLCTEVTAVLPSTELVELNRLARVYRRDFDLLARFTLSHVVRTGKTVIGASPDKNLLGYLRKLEQKGFCARIGKPFKYNDTDPDEAHVYISRPSQLAQLHRHCSATDASR